MKLALLLASTVMLASGPSAHPSALNANLVTAEKPWTTAQRDADTASSPVHLSVSLELTDATTASRLSARPAIPEFLATRI